MDSSQELVEVDVITEAEETECTNTKCHQEIQIIQKEILKIEHEIAVGQEAYHRELIGNLKKDILIEELKMQIETLKNSRFDAFRNDISKAAISQLRAINESEKKTLPSLRLLLMIYIESTCQN